MKVLVIWRLLTVGGVNAGWRNRAIQFKKHGIDTEFLYTTDHGGLHIMQDVSRVYLTKDESEIISILQMNHYDAIIVVDTGDAYRWIRKSNYQGPVIVEVRTPELCKLYPHIHNFEGICPVVMVVPSEFERRLASIVVEDIPIQVIYNGIETNIFRPLSGEELDLESDPVLPKDKKIIGWIGRLDKRKNWRTLLHIAKLVRRERDDVEFWVIGGAQSVERDVFADAWREQQMTDTVKWYPVVPYQQMPHLYAKIRQSGGCTLATTRVESFGNTFIESMACGVPVIAPNISSIPEIVIHGESGLVYRDEHARGATRQIYRLFDNPPLYKSISETGMERVRRRFSIAMVAETYIQFLYKIVSGHPKAIVGDIP